ncbi:MAG: TolC family protein [Muribaculaceae bacterium]
MKFKVMIAVWVLGILGAAGETLEECHRLAQENYPLIKRTELLRMSEQFTVSNIKKGWLPQVDVSAQATYQSDVVALPDAMIGMLQSTMGEVKGLKKDQYRIGVDVHQTLYDGGAISARSEESAAQVAVDQNRNEVDLYAIGSRVNDIYFGILLTEQRMALNTEMQRLLSANEEKIGKMLAGGVAMECDRDAIRAELLTAKQQMASLEMQRAALVRMLSLFCGKNIESVEKPSGAVTLGDESFANRPEMALFDSQLALTKSKERVIDAGLLPKISLFAQGYYGYPGLNMYDDMFRHRMTLNGIVGARVQWTIGNLYRHKNDKAMLANQRQQIENQREVFALNNKMLSAQEHETISGYCKVIAHDDEIISLLTDVRKASEAKLEHGIVDVTTLLQHIVKENRARINRSNHEIEQMQHIYNLKFINNN